MTLQPRAPKDLLLAPVAAEIDRNLTPLRDRAPQEIDDAVVLALNEITSGSDRARRAGWITQIALTDVDLHGWAAEITDDGARLRLSGGSLTIDLGLSASLLAYIENGR